MNLWGGILKDFISHRWDHWGGILTGNLNPTFRYAQFESIISYCRSSSNMNYDHTKPNIYCERSKSKMISANLWSEVSLLAVLLLFLWFKLVVLLWLLSSLLLSLLQTWFTIVKKWLKIRCQATFGANKGTFGANRGRLALTGDVWR